MVGAFRIRALDLFRIWEFVLRISTPQRWISVYTTRPTIPTNGTTQGGPMILVTGSSGPVGSDLLKQLTAKGEKVRAAYHSRPPAARGVEGARVALSTGEGLDTALAGCDTVFLLSGGLPDQTAAELRAVEAARRKGVRRLVKLSVWGAEGEDFSFARVHRPVEKAIEKSGIAYTFLRPNGFMQNFVTYDGETIRSHGAFYYPCHNAAVSHIDVRDIAAVGVAALRHKGKEDEGRAYTLS